MSVLFRPVIIAATAAILCAVSLALFWPGIAMYDSVQQFAQALTSDFDDWHPPIMAHVWAALHGAFGGAGGPMLVLQMALYWLGLGLVAAALAALRHMRLAVLTLVIGALPLFVAWQGVVLKDTQMLGAMLAAVGVVAWWRLRGARTPWLAIVAAAVLLAYATLIRANAVFATVPLAVMLFAPARWWVRGALCIGGIGVVLALAPTINHGVLGAGSSGVERTEAVYDLAGIAVRDPDAAVGLTPAEARTIAARHCLKPLFWDPLGEPTRCAPIVARFHDVPPGQMYRWLAEAVARHPIDYAAHRLAHLNSTDRWLVAAGWPGAVPPTVSEANTLGLQSPGAAARGWQVLARWMAETPLGWPIAWIVLAVTGFAVVLRRAPSGLRDLAAALLVSALMLEASFGVLSIASDLRYHLWPMVATALASVLLLAERRWPRRAMTVGGAVLLAVIASGTVARLLLPVPPTTYRALLQ